LSNRLLKADYSTTPSNAAYIKVQLLNHLNSGWIAWDDVQLLEPDPANVTTRQYYYAGGQRIAMRENGALYWLLTDHLGSTAITASADGTTELAELRYKAWGEYRDSGYAPSDTPTTYRFTGQREDATIQLLFYNARYYDGALGRFIQADTIVPNPSDPQSLNRYSYVRNNALKYIDPSGHDVDCSPWDAACTAQVAAEAVAALWDPDWSASVEDADRLAAEQAFVHYLNDPLYFTNLFADPKAWNASEEVAALDVFAQYSVLHTRASELALAPLSWDDRAYARAAHTLYGLGADEEDVSKYVAFLDLRDESGSDSYLAVAGIAIPGLIAAAEKQYPTKAGHWEWHHYIPIYLGGDPQGTQYQIPAAYHQYITNEFRKWWGYGKGKPDLAYLRYILVQVYEKYPIPPGSKER
jgi:RHS repeat-associated protein